MTVRITTQIHLGVDDVSHKMHTGQYATLDIGYGTESTLYLHFESPAQIDAVIAELVALRAEMTAEPEPEHPAYRLACGCVAAVDCTCPFCEDGTPHAPLTPWRCDEHGVTVIAASAAA